jgi:DNA-binding response OmpR family regulator
MSQQHIIVQIDDDPEDLDLMKNEIEKYENVELVQATDGYSGLTLLNQLIQKGTRPCLLVLDVNMPGMNGKDVLVEMKKDELLKDIPVTIFTTSNSVLDKLLASRYNANFVTKPLSFQKFDQVVKEIISSCTGR